MVEDPPNFYRRFSSQARTPPAPSTSSELEGKFEDHRDSSKRWREVGGGGGGGFSIECNRWMSRVSYIGFFEKGGAGGNHLIPPTRHLPGNSAYYQCFDS